MISKVLGYAHFSFLVIWLVFSTLIYGIAVIFISLLSCSMANYFVRLWSKQLLLFAGVRVSSSGIENIKEDSSYVFISNHSSVFDIPVLYSVIPNRVGFIAKKGLFKIPLFGQVMRSSGSLMLDRENARTAKEVLKKAVKKVIVEKRSIIIFPEGTRNKDSKVPGQFKSGSFFIAQDSGIEFVPVYIDGTGEIVRNGFIPHLISRVKISFGKPVVLDSMLPRSVISEKMRNAVISLIEE